MNRKFRLLGPTAKQYEGEVYYVEEFESNKLVSTHPVLVPTGHDGDPKLFAQRFLEEFFRTAIYLL